jgi:Holliday junction DNA helicase RuvA
MITSIQGKLAMVSPLLAVVELNGLGYEVCIPMTTAEKLPAPGDTVRLHTHVVYREDSQTLYGFTTTAERDFFRLLIEKVTGAGSPCRCCRAQSPPAMWPPSPNVRASAKRRRSAW